MNKITSKDVFIRALECLAHEKYVSKTDAAIGDKMSTAEQIINSFEYRADHLPEEINNHEKKAIEIVDWLSNYTVLAGDDYMANCKRALALLDGPDPVQLQKVVPLLCSCIQTFERCTEVKNMYSNITQVNAFYADAGATVVIDVADVIGVQKYPDYQKISVCTKTGHLVSFYHKAEAKKTCVNYNVGDKISISGKVSRNKFTTPFDTVITRPKVTKF